MVGAIAVGVRSSPHLLVDTLLIATVLNHMIGLVRTAVHMLKLVLRIIKATFMVLLVVLCLLHLGLFEIVVKQVGIVDLLSLVELILLYGICSIRTSILTIVVLAGLDAIVRGSVRVLDTLWLVLLIVDNIQVTRLLVLELDGEFRHTTALPTELITI